MLTEQTIDLCLKGTNIALYVEGRDDLPYRILSLARRRDTAFALPSWWEIVVLRTLWTVYHIESQAELAFVLCHEKAHIQCPQWFKPPQLAEVEADFVAVQELKRIGYPDSNHIAYRVLLKLHGQNPNNQFLLERAAIYAPQGEGALCASF